MDYVDRFACDWHRLATTDPKDSTAPIIVRFSENSKKNFSSGSIPPGKTAWAGCFSLSRRQMIDLCGHKVYIDGRKSIWGGCTMATQVLTFLMAYEGLEDKI